MFSACVKEMELANYSKQLQIFCISKNDVEWLADRKVLMQLLFQVMPSKDVSGALLVAGGVLPISIQSDKPTRGGKRVSPRLVAFLSCAGRSNVELDIDEC
jgi:hypothetical protein